MKTILLVLFVGLAIASSVAQPPLTLPKGNIDWLSQIEEANSKHFLSRVAADNAALFFYPSRANETYGNLLIPFNARTHFNDLLPMVNQLTKKGWNLYLSVSKDNHHQTINDQIRSSLTLLTQSNSDKTFMLVIDHLWMDFFIDEDNPKSTKLDVEGIAGTALLVLDIPFGRTFSLTQKLRPPNMPTLFLVTDTVRQEFLVHWSEVIANDNVQLAIVPPSGGPRFDNMFSTKKLHGWMKNQVLKR